jgi:hypothetical protein
MKKFAVRAMFGLWIVAAPFAIVGCDEPAKEPAKGAPPVVNPGPAPTDKKAETPKTP